MRGNFSLTISMLALTILGGVIIWFGYDYYQYRALDTVLSDTLKQRFNEQARQQRLRFDHYIKSYSPSVKLYATNHAVIEYSRVHDWASRDKVRQYTTTPPWLPALSAMRRFILPRYAMLVSADGRVREMYAFKNPPPAKALMQFSPLLLELSDNQSYLAVLDDKPYLLASKIIPDTDALRLMIASPIDARFLQDAQHYSSETAVVALLNSSNNRILVSSDPQAVKPGTLLDDLAQDYIFVGKRFFDSGSAELVISFYSMMPTDEVNRQTGELLMRDRLIRAVTALTFITAFALAMFWITSRIRKLTDKVVRFSGEMNIPQPHIHHRDELLELEARFELLARAVHNETRALEHQALHDPLTNIPNRKLFNQRIEEAIDNSEAHGGHFVIMLCDLNLFKQVNDTLGHHAGDAVLKQASERIQMILRKNDTVARLGGDEFGILLPGTELQDAEPIARKINKVFAGEFHFDSHTIHIGISIGIASYPVHGTNKGDLMQRADIAMYHAKREGTGYSVFSTDKRYIALASKRA